MKVSLIAAIFAVGAAPRPKFANRPRPVEAGDRLPRRVLPYAEPDAVRAGSGQATAGQLKIEVHPNNTLAKLAEIRQAVQEGKAEAGETIMTSMVKDMPIAGADSMPFVVSSYADAQRMWRLQRPLIERHFARAGPEAAVRRAVAAAGPVLQQADAWLGGFHRNARCARTTRPRCALPS